MAEDDDKDSKTEEPTEKKIQDALKKGQTPVSRELPLLTSLACFSAYLIFSSEDLFSNLTLRLTGFFGHASQIDISTAFDANNIFIMVTSNLLWLMGPLLVLLMIGGVLSSFLQNEPRMVLDRVMPKVSRISLIKGWSKLFGKQGLVEFAKSVAKLCFTGGVVFGALYSAPETLLNGMFQHPASFNTIVKELIERLLIAVCLAMLLVAIADVLWSRHHWRENLRMTHKEVTDEVKQAEGDPILKARMRSIARDRSRQRMMEAVPTATLIIANPTHIAIALRFDDKVDQAPVVVAKGQDLIALKIREIAEDHRVPVFERVDLARALNKAVKVDQIIPQEFFVAVAELIKIIYNRTR